MQKVLIIDNYDSFTYNLVHMVNEITGQTTDVWKNDDIDYKTILQYTHIILSPGPGIPEEAGDLKKVIQEVAGHTLLFGVCLGLQAIGEVYGASLKNLDSVFHGIKTPMYKTDISTPIFEGIQDEFEAGRYHSWVIDKSSNTDALHITAVDNQGEIMAIQHKELPIYAVQFHPESIMTPEGYKMITNFLKLNLR